jgi:hypothetical protein
LERKQLRLFLFERCEYLRADRAAQRSTALRALDGVPLSTASVDDRAFFFSAFSISASVARLLARAGQS